jgi:hypothetical protein
MRFAIGLNLLWKRIELILCALVVPGLILESSFANGWVYGGTFVGFLRGLFLDLVIYICARQAFLLFKKKSWLGAVVMAFVSISITYVSAVNNLGWVLSGHEMAGVLGSLGQVMGTNNPLYHIYQFSLAVCLPFSLLAIALVDLDQFFVNGINQDHLDTDAMLSDERRMHRTAYLKAQKAQKEVIQEQYQDIAETRAQTFVDGVRSGDLTFGAGQVNTDTLSIQEEQTKQLKPPVNEVTGTVWPADAPRQRVGGSADAGQQGWSDWR